MQSESDFQAQVIQLARQYGWLVYHHLPAMNRRGKWGSHVQGDKGWPDLVLCKPPHLYLFELKSEKGKASSEQQAWIDALVASGQGAKILRPSDWDYIVSVIVGKEAYEHRQ